jgi:hypothetical protein
LPSRSLKERTGTLFVLIRTNLPFRFRSSVAVTRSPDLVGSRTPFASSARGLALSSFVIVPRAPPSPITASPGLPSVNERVSSLSYAASPFTTTFTVLLAAPAGIVSVPDAAT